MANLESFSRAAQSLHLTQSAVSQSVKKLEEELSCQLFIRYSRKTILTPEGKELYQKIQAAFSCIQKGEQTVADMMAHRQQELRIGATETSIRFYLPKYIKKWQTERPELRLTLLGTTTNELCRLLTEEHISEAFLITPLPADASFLFDLEKIGEIQDIPVSSTTFYEEKLRSCDTELSIEDLSQYPLISVSEENSVRKLFQQWFLFHGLDFSPQYTVPHMGLVLSLVEQDLGIGLVPFPFVKEKLADGKLRQLQVSSLPSPRVVYLARKKNVHAFFGS